MDIQKTKIYLDKLNREFARMSKDPDTVVRLDVDIMASYVRELYDAILSDSSEVANAKNEAAPRKSNGGRNEPNAPESAAPPVQTPAPPPPAPALAPVEEVVKTPPPPPAPVAPAPPPPPVVPEPVIETIASPAPTMEPTPPPAPPTPPVTVKPPAPASPVAGAEVLFEEKQAKELSEKLSELPIADLKKAIALNDRLLLTRELFAGDGQAFENTIQALNGLSNFNDAKNYLLENCVVRYLWVDKKRVDVAKDFIKLVRRRYK